MSRYNSKSNVSKEKPKHLIIQNEGISPDEKDSDTILCFTSIITKGNELKKRKRSGGGPGPFWWKMGSKRLLYEALIEPRSRPRKLKGSTGSAAP